MPKAGDESGAQRVAGLDDFLGGEPAVEAGEPGAHAVDVPGQQPVGDAGKPILLLDDRGDAGLGRRPEERAAGEPADADGHIRFEPPHDPAAHPQRAEEPEREQQVSGGELAVDARDGQPGDGVSGGRDALHFHAASGPDELDDHIGPAGRERFGDGQRRVDVATCASTGDQDAQRAVRHGRFGWPVGGRGSGRGAVPGCRWARRPRDR